MKSNLGFLHKIEALSHLDVQLAFHLGRLSPAEPESVLFAAALVSHGVTMGHVCINPMDWKQLLDLHDPDLLKQIPIPENHGAWVEDLKDSILVSDGKTYTPLVIDDNGRLYLRRYWAYQQAFVDGIFQRMKTPCHDVSHALLNRYLDHLFPVHSAGGQKSIQNQRTAAETVARQSFTVISGGPGTGKTTTVLNILALLQLLAREQGLPALRCHLLAPTGKAAARLSETIRQRRQRLDIDAHVISTIPTDASTIHRCLGLRPDKPGQARHHRDNPLRTDLVILDEASMVDLPLMAKLEQAVPPNSRLVFLGDPEQLASVEVGAVFGDICRTFSEIDSKKTAELKANGTKQKESAAPHQGKIEKTNLIVLTHQFRFSQKSRFAALAQAVKTGDKKRIAGLLTASQTTISDDSIAMIRLEAESRLAPVLRPHILSSFEPYLTAMNPTACLENFDRFRILCALRYGRYGALNVNKIVESVLAEEEMITPNNPFYAYRPIMITKNDYQLQLYNGDIGLVLPDGSGTNRVFFPAEEGEARSVNPAHLPQHETAFCLTIHKAQGSEFDQVFLLLPPHDSQILSRELVYTGITRARSRLILASGEETLQIALDRRIRRPSGIREAFLAQMESGISSP